LRTNDTNKLPGAVVFAPFTDGSRDRALGSLLSILAGHRRSSLRRSRDVDDSIQQCGVLTSLQFPISLRALRPSVIDCPALPELVFLGPTPLEIVQDSICRCRALAVLRLPSALFHIVGSLIKCSSLSELSNDWVSGRPTGQEIGERYVAVFTLEILER
jgi:hypothetical protein